MRSVEFDVKDVITILGKKIANLEIQLANTESARLAPCEQAWVCNQD